MNQDIVEWIDQVVGPCSVNLATRLEIRGALQVDETRPWLVYQDYELRRRIDWATYAAAERVAATLTK
jgi:hypothetical protein